MAPLEMIFLPIQIFVKIDIEGYVLSVLRGGERLFSDPNVGAVIIEIGGDFRVHDSKLHETILTHGFRPVSYEPNSRALIVLSNCNPDDNTIYVKGVIEAKRLYKAVNTFLLYAVFGNKF